MASESLSIPRRKVEALTSLYVYDSEISVTGEFRVLGGGSGSKTLLTGHDSREKDPIQGGSGNV